MKIEIDFKNAEDDTLVELCTALENAIPGLTITSKQVHVLEVNDSKAAAILQSVFSGKIQREGEKKTANTERKRRALRQDVPYTFLTGHRAGQTIAGGALGRTLKAGNLAPGTRLTHPVRGEVIVVTNEKNIHTLQAASE